MFLQLPNFTILSIYLPKNFTGNKVAEPEHLGRYCHFSFYFFWANLFSLLQQKKTPSHLRLDVVCHMMS